VATTFGARILLLCPHPDDETVGFCAAIGRARAAGSKVSVLFLTHGCVSRGTMWPWARRRYDEAVARRRREAEAACAMLGLEIAGGSPRPARYLWRELAAGEAEVRAAASRISADQLWVTAFEGGNPDHDGANAIASRLAAEGLSVLEFAEYNLEGGKIRPHTFPAPNGAEEVLTLTEAEQAAKRRAVAIYVSERGNLRDVDYRRETYRPLAAYDYGRPPHPGKLWWARFQWVPFRHPMVDFTQPADVYGAIAGYLAARTPSP
jgi:LmbE family N-acetylglucosaminyl deacetylase